jgi:GR25 family glycosyltransferase involved in LPS biosynthesis
METILDGTYVINMDADTRRLEEFDIMMSSCNWNYSRFPAINGKKLMSSWSNITDAKEREQLTIQLALKQKYVSPITWLSASEIGCLLSHVSLWEQLVNNPNMNRIAIFEDDARTHLDGITIHKLLNDFYTYLSSNNISEPDMLYLGKALDDCMNYEKVWGNIYKSTHPLCLHAYIITKQGAQKLITQAPYSLAIDMIPIKTIEKRILTAMAFHPSLYFQDIFNNTSNLRELKGAINNTTECLVSQQHIAGDTWHYTFIIVIGLIAAIILFILYMLFWPSIYISPL